MLGAGWQVRPAAATSLVGIGVVVRMGRKRVGKVHAIRLELLDYDGNVVVIGPPDGPGQMVFDGALVIAGLSDPSLKTPLLGGYALNLPPFPLEPGREYQWRLHVDGKTRPGCDPTFSDHTVLIAKLRWWSW